MILRLQPELICLYLKWKRYENSPCRSICKSGARIDIRIEIFIIGLGTNIMGTELNKEKQVAKMGETSLFLSL